MDYGRLLEQAIAALPSGFSLAELLRRVDALDKSVPTLEELNAALAGLQKSRRCGSYDCKQVTRDAYNRAIAENWEWMTQMLESQGISRERQQQILREHARRWGKHET
jgi:hypothetical protein